MKVFKFKKLLFWVLFTEIVLLTLSALFVYVIFPGIDGAKLLNIEYVYVLLVGTAFSILYVLLYLWKHNTLSKFADARLLSAYIPPLSTRKIFFKFGFIRLAILLGSVALLRPQLGSKLVEAKVEGIDIVFCLDVSQSMLTQDVKPNRLERAKRLIGESISKLRGDRVGIIIFAGEAFVQLPITNDYRAAGLFLNTIETDFISTQGTAIGQALNLAKESFNQEEAVKKAVVLITDGENHEDDAMATAELLADEGIQVFAIGIGSEKGGPIPLSKNNNSFKTDKDGNIVVSKFNPMLIQGIADKGNGTAFVANDTKAVVKDLMNELKNIEKSEMGTSVYAEYQDRYQMLLLPCLLFIILELCINERKKRTWKRKLWL